MECGTWYAQKVKITHIEKFDNFYKIQFRKGKLRGTTVSSNFLDTINSYQPFQVGDRIPLIGLEECCHSCPDQMVSTVYSNGAEMYNSEKDKGIYVNNLNLKGNYFRKVSENEADRLNRRNSEEAKKYEDSLVNSMSE